VGVDGADFVEFVRARHARLVRTAVLLGCPVADAEDAVQNALVIAYPRWAQATRGGRPDAYVHRILVNHVIRSRRRRWRGETPTELLPDAPGHALDAAVDTALTVRRALRRLSKDQQVVIVLRFYVDLTEREVAEALDLPVGTVKSRCARGLQALVRTPELSWLMSNAGSAERNGAG
jgi:RNA polymerase sigma-70 factor (sigma-E family)